MRYALTPWQRLNYNLTHSLQSAYYNVYTCPPLAHCRQKKAGVLLLLFPTDRSKLNFHRHRSRSATCNQDATGAARRLVTRTPQAPLGDHLIVHAIIFKMVYE